MKSIISSDHIYQYPTISTDPTLADLPVGTQQTFRNTSTGDLEHWGNNNGVIEKISGGGGGGSQTLDQVLTEGNIANLLYTDVNYKFANWVVPTSTPLNSNFGVNIKKITPSEYGTNATVGLWSESIGEYQSGQEGSPTARKNVVWSWGYNIDQGIANEGYLRFGMESNYRPGGGAEWFEWHAPEVMTRDGNINRWYSITGSKATPSAAHLLRGSTFSFLDIANPSIELFRFGGGTCDIKGDIIRFNSLSDSAQVRVNIAGDDAYLILAPTNTSNNAFIECGMSDLYVSAKDIHFVGTLYVNENAFGTNTAFNGTTIYGNTGFVLNLAANSSTSGSAIIQGNGSGKTDYYTIELNLLSTSGEGTNISFDNRGLRDPMSFWIKPSGTTSQTYAGGISNQGNWHFGNTDQYSMPASSIVTMESTTKGFLPPRMTTTQKNAISSPAEGLMVYDTTLHKLCVYTGSAWETIVSA
jgi:hypothetical protein